VTDLIDARNMACPQPVLLTRNALANMEEGVVSVLVKNDASVENVKRFAESQGCTVAVVSTEDGTRLDITRGFACAAPAENKGQVSASPVRPERIMFISSDSLGADVELGRKLLAGFLSTLTQMSDAELPSTLIFVNRGVYVTCTWPDTIAALKSIEARNVTILSCGTCLEHFGLMDQLQVGKVGSALDSVQALLNGERIINLG